MAKRDDEADAKLLKQEYVVDIFRYTRVSHLEYMMHWMESIAPSNIDPKNIVASVARSNGVCAEAERGRTAVLSKRRTTRRDVTHTDGQPCWTVRTGAIGAMGEG